MPRTSGHEDRPTVPFASSTAPGAIDIAGYELLHRIGVGGMGEVWEAEQLVPVRRRVAIKLVKAGMDSEEVLGRFGAERQALALMDHPAIARVFDAGTTAQGRPFFVMELVRGVPILDYADAHRLTLAERLALFVKVCRGVEHAHQKAILHRDLKPSNILVGEQDGVPVPKIIDFGIAKAMGHSLTEADAFTRLGEVIGTPEYMSPEQAGSGGEAVDTRSDVYSLGVVLYELLAGAPPFDPDELRRLDFVSALLKIRDEEPPRPSTRLLRLGEGSAAPAELRRTSGAALLRTLRGDLDWIVMKAIDKDPARRYDSVHALAQDLQRHLRQEPVEARPPTAAYRLGKLVRRHRLEFAAGTLALLALVVGLVLATVGLVRAREAQRRAEREASTAKRVTDLLVGVFDESDPTGPGGGREITAREALERGARRIDSLHDEPLVEAQVRLALGRVFENLGDFGRADAMLRRSIALFRRQPGQEVELSGALHNLGVLEERLGKTDEAATALGEALRLVESRPEVDQKRLAMTLNSLAVVEMDRGRFPQAQRLFERALRIKESLPATDPSELSSTLDNLAILAINQGQLARAEPLLLRSLALERKARGDEHPDVADTLNNLGSVYEQQQRLPEARAAFQRALAIWQKALGPENPDTAIAIHNLGNVARDGRRWDEAFAFYARADAIWTKALGPEHSYLAQSYQDQAEARRRMGDPAAALELLRRSLAIWEHAAGPQHPSTLDVRKQLDDLVAKTGGPP